MGYLIIQFIRVLKGGFTCTDVLAILKYVSFLDVLIVIYLLKVCIAYKI